MRIVQLDEDIDAEHLVKACAIEGKISAYRFPEKLRNQAAKDPFVLDSLLPRGNPLLTADKEFIEDHLDRVPNKHPGIIIVDQDDDAVPTMTTHIAQRMLAKFKDDCEGWHEASWENSVVTIRDSAVVVYRVEDGNIIDRKDWPREKAKPWQAEVLSRIEFNANQ